MIVADIIGRKLFKSTPILSLWANRNQRTLNSKYPFFDSTYNENTLNAVKESVVKIDTSEPLTIFLIDDHLGTGNTAKQAVGYIKENLGEKTSILFIPLISNEKFYLEQIDEYLPYNYVSIMGDKISEISKDDFISGLSTESSFFPYLNKQVRKSTQ